MNRRTLLKVLGATAAGIGAYVGSIIPEVALAAGRTSNQRLPTLAYHSTRPVSLQAHELNMMRDTLGETRSLSRSEYGIVTVEGKPYARSWAGEYLSAAGAEVIGVYILTNHGSQMAYAASRDLHTDGSFRLTVWGVSTRTGFFTKLWDLDIAADRSSVRAHDLETGRIVEPRPVPAASATNTASARIRTAEASGGCDFCEWVCTWVQLIGCYAGVTAICNPLCGPVFWGCMVPCSIIAASLCNTLGFFSCIDACTILGYC